MSAIVRMRMAMLTAAILVAGVLAATGQAPRKPLAKQEIVDLLKSGVSPARVEELARQYGISFEVTAEAEDDLLAAGATEPLVAALRELSRKTPESPTPAPAQTTLLIEASPGGAQVYVDDELAGTTSAQGRLKIPRIPSGEHQLRLSLAGHKDFEQKISLEPGETARVFAKLEPVPAPEPPAPATKVAEPVVDRSLEQQSEQSEKIVQAVGHAVVNISGMTADGRRALGSGVVVSPDGFVATNRHVVVEAREVAVTLADKRTLPAKIVGLDAPTDLALLRVDTSGLSALAWGDSTALRTGAIVLALGNPLGQGVTVSRGVVSVAGQGSLRSRDFIQTDAAINPGNSGGALVNIRGELVGINTAIVSSRQPPQADAAASRIGFAIPAHMARPVLDSLRTMGKVLRGYVGVAVSNLTPEMARYFRAQGGSGALVNDVAVDSPAARAGLRPGDVIRSCNGRQIDSAEQFISIVANQPPGTAVQVALLREGRPVAASLVLAERPVEAPSSTSPQAGTGPTDPYEQALSESPPRRSDRRITRGPLRGMTVRVPEPRARRRLGLGPEGGLFVTFLEAECPAAKAGMRRGDLIESINRRPVKSADDLQKLAAGAQGEVLLRVSRRGNAFFMLVSAAQ